jgi:transcription elongation factor Elf1
MLTYKIGKDLSIIGAFTCPKCGAVSEHNLSEKQAGDSIACLCGARIELTNDGFAEARRLLKDFKELFK